MGKKRTSSVKRWTLVVIVLALLVAVLGGTYSRYSSNGIVSTSANIAKWNIVLGDGISDNDQEDQNISAEQKTINVTAVKDATFSNGNVVDDKLAPGQRLVATWEVDPSGSEVAVDYIMQMGTVVASVNNETYNTNSDIQVTKVEATVDNVTSDAILSDGKYYFYENLANVTGNKKVTFKAYLKWNDFNTSETNTADTSNGASVDKITLPVTITARQHLASDGYKVAVASTEGLASAVAAAHAGDTISLTDDLVFAGTSGFSNPEDGTEIILPENSTLDLNGHNLTVRKLSYSFKGNNFTLENGSFKGIYPPTSYGLFIGWNSNYGVDNINHGATIRNITVDGGINLQDIYDVVFENVKVKAHDYYAVYCNTRSTVTIKSGLYEAGDLALLGYCISDTDSERGNTTNQPGGMVIEGGTFLTHGKALYLSNAQHGAPVIKGGSFDIDVTQYIDGDTYKCTYNDYTGLYDVTPKP